MSFDALAPHYRWMEWVLAGKKLQRCRVAFLPQIPQARQILLLGEGHGRALLECRRRFPETQITCVDASEPMLIEARRRLTHHGLSSDGVEFIHADALDWSPRIATYDLIVTNFFLDCFREEQLGKLSATLAEAATPHANWLLADFQVPVAGMKRLRSRLIIWSMYLFFRFATKLPARRLTAPDGYLKAAGFGLRERRETEWGLLHSDWWQR